VAIEHEEKVAAVAAKLIMELEAKYEGRTRRPRLRSCFSSLP
jgi:hypothetical protein